MSVRASYPAPPDLLAKIEARYAAELTETENRVFFFEYDERGSATGYVQMLLINADNDPELANGRDIAHVHDLRVHQELQGTGIARRLMDRMEENARERGIRYLTLGVDDTNLRAIEFYRRRGYATFKTTPGRTDDELCFFMRKRL